MYDAGAAAAAVAADLHSGIMRSASTATAGPVHGDAPLLPGCAPEADPAPEAAGAGAMLTRGACSHAGVPVQDRSPALRGKAGHVAKGGPGAAASAVAGWPEDAHAGAGTAAAAVPAWPQVPPADAAPRARLHAALERDDAWMAKFTKVNRIEHPGVAFHAVWGPADGDYVACAGDTGVTILEPATMRVRCSFTSAVPVHAVSGSASGDVLAYGLRSGDVVMRDMTDAGRLLPPVPRRHGTV